MASSVTQAATSNNRSGGIGDLTAGRTAGALTVSASTSITKTSIRVASIGQGGGQDLGILSHAGSHQVVELILSVELASSSVRSSSTGDEW